MRYYSVKDRNTFSALMLRYRGLLYAVCRRYARGGLEVDDLLQETTLALWHLRDRLADMTPAPKQAAWIWRVARNRCIDMQRRTAKTEPLPAGYDIPADDPTLHNELHELIGRLDEPDRTIVRMYLDGYEYKEIGYAVGMTKNNIGIRLMRIKNKLKQQWNTI